MESNTSDVLYRSLFELSPDGIITTDLKGMITSVNQAFLNLTGFSKEELVGKHFRHLGTMRVQDLPKYVKLFTDILRGKIAGTFESQYLHKDGEVGWSEVRLGLIKDAGKMVGMQAIVRDITKRKKAEESLRSSEEKYRTLVEMAPDIIITSDLNGVITSFNKSGEKLSGYSEDEVIGKHFSEIGVIQAKDLPNYLSLFISALRKEITKPLEVILQHKDGTPRTVEIKWGLLRSNAKGMGIQSIMRDVTECKRVEEALRESQEKLRGIFDSMSDGILVTDLNGVYC